MAVHGMGGGGESVPCVVGLRGGPWKGKECGWEWCLSVLWALCLRDGRTCDSTDGQCACLFAQVYATGLEIVPVSSPYLRHVITLFPKNRRFHICT